MRMNVDSCLLPVHVIKNINYKEPQMSVDLRFALY